MSIIQATQRLRSEGLPLYFTIDAGPNVHLICEAEYMDTVVANVRHIPGVKDVLSSEPGGQARAL